jgi:hypothetical protein
MGNAPEREAAGSNAPGGHEGDDHDREAQVATVEVVFEEHGWAEPLLAVHCGRWSVPDAGESFPERCLRLRGCRPGAAQTEGVWVVQTVVHRAAFRSESFGLTREEAGSQGLVGIPGGGAGGGRAGVDLQQAECFGLTCRPRPLLGRWFAAQAVSAGFDRGWRNAPAVVSGERHGWGSVDKMPRVIPTTNISSARDAEPRPARCARCTANASSPAHLPRAAGSMLRIHRQRPEMRLTAHLSRTSSS